MIEETIKSHDNYQFEIKLNYGLHKDRPITAYDIDTYLFIPNSLGINRATYSKDDFYNDIHTYVRLKTPSVPLAGVAEAPLARLRTSLEKLAAEPTGTSAAHYEYQVKIFCCILKSSIRDYVHFVEKTADPQDRARLVADCIETLQRLTAAYRDLRPIIQVPQVPEKLFTVYLFGDEYISLQAEDNSGQLLELVGRGPPGAENGLRKRLLDLIESEVKYRRSRNYPSIPDEKADNEQLVFRRGVLKKYTSSVLFLSTRTRPGGKLLEHVLFGLAAGLAMLFATAVAFVSQSLYGGLTLPVFLALVIGYVFKDRLKDLLRLYFARKVSGWLFDHKTYIYSSPTDQVGHCREGFDFVSEAQVPEEVRKLRNRDHITEIENGWVGEQVIQYRKRIRLFSRAIARIFEDYDIAGVNDILRFNIMEFLRNMGGPKRHLLVVDEDDYQRVTGDRVYHLNMILKYEVTGKTVYKRFRIVLNRQGIKRIEPVSVEELQHA
ncbi:MAG: hypothetical protein JXB04_08715 [Kiritimatiellae bacterium]|nr:hypothetical protein [Kiritimatiellia bacterium]